MKKVETEEEYSYNELLSIGKAINNLLLKAKENKYDRKLVYFLNKNIKIIQRELETIEEGFPTISEELEDKVNEYTSEIREVALAQGGKKAKTEEGREYIDVEHEDFNKEVFDEIAEEIEEEYEDVLNEVNDINEQIRDHKEDKISNVYLYKFKLDMFPEQLNLDDMPINIIDLIEED